MEDQGRNGIEQPSQGRQSWLADTDDHKISYFPNFLAIDTFSLESNNSPSMPLKPPAPSVPYQAFLFRTDHSTEVKVSQQQPVLRTSVLDSHSGSSLPPANLSFAHRTIVFFHCNDDHRAHPAWSFDLKTLLWLGSGGAHL